MIRALYDWTIDLADHPRALWALACVAFIESSFFPIPPDALLIPMILANPRKAWLYAGVATLASVMGGLLGYGIGAFAFDQIGQPILTALGKKQAALELAERFNAIGFWAILIAGVTPLPFKVITIMSGWTAIPIELFLTTIFIARGIRFFVVAALLWLFGDSIRHFIERYLGWLFILFVIMLISGAIGVTYL